MILSCNFISKVPTHHCTGPSRHLIIIKMLARENAVAVALTGADVSVVANNNKCIVNYSVLLKKENKITTKNKTWTHRHTRWKFRQGWCFTACTHSFIHLIIISCLLSTTRNFSLDSFLRTTSHQPHHRRNGWLMARHQQQIGTAKGRTREPAMHVLMCKSDFRGGKPNLFTHRDRHKTD